MGNLREKKYMLNPGAQVREEDFGLLFYTMAGPRLYSLSSGELLGSHFFDGQLTLQQWIERRSGRRPVPKERVLKLKEALNQLKEKGVILEF